MKRLANLRLKRLFIIVLVLFPLSVAQAQTARQIAQKVFPSVVLLVMEDANGQPVSLGSGFFVSDGIIATNLHVIEGAARGYAKLIGQRKRYDISGMVGIDRARDLVLLAAVGTKAPPLPSGDSTKVAVGDEVYVVGNPQGLEGTFSQGIVSGIRKVGSGKLLQITAPISPGSSGGPVLNAQGKVIGVAVATFEVGQNLNFAIPASYLTSLLSEIKPVKPLSAKTRPKKDKSILDGLGERSSEGVAGNLFAWDYEIDFVSSMLGSYTFSLQNKLSKSVKNVYCLVVFYDYNDNPIDVDVVRFQEVIPSGLAKRVNSKVDGSVRKLVNKSKPYRELETEQSTILEYIAKKRPGTAREEFTWTEYQRWLSEYIAEKRAGTGKTEAEIRREMVKSEPAKSGTVEIRVLDFQIVE